MKTKRNIIIAVTVFACGVMGVVDAVIQPGYLVKSLIKLLLFLCIPIVYSVFDKNCDLKKLFVPDKKGLLTAVILGVGYIVTSDYRRVSTTEIQVISIENILIKWVCAFGTLVKALAVINSLNHYIIVNNSRRVNNGIGIFFLLNLIVRQKRAGC